MVMFETFWSGFVFAVGITFAMVVLAMFGGGFIDDIYTKSETWPGATSDYVSQSQGTVNWFINLYYVMCAGITVFAWLVFFQSWFKKDSSSRYFDRPMR